MLAPAFLNTPAILDLDALTVPVALVPGFEDSYVPRVAILPFLDAVVSDDTRVFELPTDAGTFVHPSDHGTYWPRICERASDRS